MNWSLFWFDCSSSTVSEKANEKGISWLFLKVISANLTSFSLFKPCRILRTKQLAHGCYLLIRCWYFPFRCPRLNIRSTFCKVLFDFQHNLKFTLCGKQQTSFCNCLSVNYAANFFGDLVVFWGCWLVKNLKNSLAEVFSSPKI